VLQPGLFRSTVCVDGEQRERGSHQLGPPDDVRDRFHMHRMDGKHTPATSAPAVARPSDAPAPPPAQSPRACQRTFHRVEPRGAVQPPVQRVRRDRDGPIQVATQSGWPIGAREACHHPLDDFTRSLPRMMNVSSQAKWFHSRAEIDHGAQIATTPYSAVGSRAPRTGPYRQGPAPDRDQPARIRDEQALQLVRASASESGEEHVRHACRSR